MFCRVYVAYHEFGSNRFLKYGGVTVERNIRYGDRKTQTFSLYRKSERVLPVVINFHGGAIAGRNKNHRRAFCVSLAKHDVAVMNVEYKGETSLGAKECLKQAETILAYLKEHHKSLALSVDKVFLAGDDVGAYVAAWLALKAPDYGIRVIGVIGLSGLYDIIGHAKETQYYSTQYHLLKKFFKIDLKKIGESSNVETLAEVSVTHKIDRDYPPTFIAHSVHDEFAPEQGDLMRGALEQYGVNCWEFKAVHERVYHNFHLNTQTRATQAVMAYLEEFILEALGGGIYRNEYREI